MQATAFVSFRDVREMVGGFEDEIFKQCGGHHELSKMRKKPPHNTGKHLFYHYLKRPFTPGWLFVVIKPIFIFYFHTVN